MRNCVGNCVHFRFGESINVGYVQCVKGMLGLVPSWVEKVNSGKPLLKIGLGENNDWTREDVADTISECFAYAEPEMPVKPIVVVEAGEAADEKKET